MSSSDATVYVFDTLPFADGARTVIKCANCGAYNPSYYDKQGNFVGHVRFCPCCGGYNGGKKPYGKNADIRDALGTKPTRKPRKNHREPTQTSKVCSVCGVEKSKDEFYLRGDGSGRLKSACKACESRLGRERRERKKLL